jgi:hypothetical protein
MSIQTIINSASGLEFDRRRVVSQSISRSQRIKTAERATAQPWTFTITPAARFNYTANRGTLETIYYADRNIETQVNLANNPGLTWLTAYQGELDGTQLSSLAITATNTTSFIVWVGASVTTGAKIFRTGDFVQPVNSRYPYTVTSDVEKGAGSTVSVPLHRPVLTSEATTLTGSILVGTSVTFRVVVVDLPNYQIVNRDQVQFSSDFRVVEKVI